VDPRTGPDAVAMRKNSVPVGNRILVTSLYQLTYSSRNVGLWSLMQCFFYFYLLQPPVPRPCVTFHNKLSCYGEELLAPRPNPKLEDHPLSAVRYYLRALVNTVKKLRVR
jgi:hypothetical protein